MMLTQVCIKSKYNTSKYKKEYENKISDYKIIKEPIGKPHNNPINFALKIFNNY